MKTSPGEHWRGYQCNLLAWTPGLSAVCLQPVRYTYLITHLTTTPTFIIPSPSPNSDSYNASKQNATRKPMRKPTGLRVNLWGCHQDLENFGQGNSGLCPSKWGVGVGGREWGWGWCCGAVTKTWRTLAKKTMDFVQVSGGGGGGGAEDWAVGLSPRPGELWLRKQWTLSR